jgi:hypothetical protein
MAGSTTGWALSLSNAGSTDLTVWLEPWCDEFVLPRRGELTLVIEADDGRGAAPELDISEDTLTVYGAVGTRIRVQIDGVEQNSGSSDITTPDMGALSIREFVDVVFGDFPQARPGGHPAPAKDGWLRRLFGRG